MTEKDLVSPKDWQMMVEICKRLYIQGKAQKRIAKELFLSTSQVSRYVQRAGALGIVKFQIEEEPSLGWKRLPRLEKELQNRFKLDRAIVVDYAYDEDSTGLQDDNLHKALAGACADFLQTWLRSREHIGVGGGRGTFYTADNLRNRAADPLLRSLAGIRVTSLTGNMSTTPWDSDTPVVDADQVAAALAAAFTNSTYRQLNAPVAPPQGQLAGYWNAGSARVLSLEVWKSDPHNYVPNVALVGVGALAGEHRFCKQVDHRLDALAALQPELDRLLALIKPVVDRGYCPVGDICNRLFFVEPSTAAQMLDQHEKDAIKDYVVSLNDKILSVNKDQLRMIREKGSLIAVAGGRFKLDAISSLIPLKDGSCLAINTLGEGISVDILCTDATTAEGLLRRGVSHEGNIQVGWH